MTLVATAVALFVGSGIALAGLGPNQASDKGLIAESIEDFRYDRANKCRDKMNKGVKKMLAWLDNHTNGESWGVYRCEKLSSDNHSIHAESRAIDWRMDARSKKEKRQAMKLINKCLLAADRSGNEAALARRMGIQGLIFDCKSWWAGASGLSEYSYCFKKPGKKRKDLNSTAAHMDHIHIEMTKRGARGKTSFWQSGLR